MYCEQDNAVITSRTDWLVELSERARAQGHGERADRLLLSAWQAYDGQEASFWLNNEKEADHQASRAAEPSVGLRIATR
jgi:hypothetical protein